MSLSALLFPTKCILCGRLLERGEKDLCCDCRVDAPVCPISRTKLPFIHGWVALWHYEDYARDSILRYKFQNRRGYAKVYGRLLADKLQQEYPDGFDEITWVPISLLRKCKRGFDQVELLAEAVGRQLRQKPKRFLKKIRHNRPQSGITGHAHRKANVLGVYKAIHTEQLIGKRVLLLDDIITTGATAGECARVLLTAGAKEVIVGAVAAARSDAKTK